MSTEWSVMMLQIPDCLGQEMVSVRSGFAVASLRTEGKHLQMSLQEAVDPSI